MSDSPHARSSFHGPFMWAASLIAGVVLGWGIVQIAPAEYGNTHHAEADAHADDHSNRANVAGASENSPGTSPGHREGVIGALELAEAGDELNSTIGVLRPPAGGTPDPARTLPDAASAHDPDSARGQNGPGSHPNASGHDQESGHGDDHHGPAPTIPLWLVVPFAVLLGSIALMPFINEKVWHHHFPDFAFFLGGIVLAYYLIGFGQGEYSHGMSYGMYQMTHVGLEYVQFIALIGGLYIASGGILINVKGRGTPIVNTGLLAFGAVIANIVGTTGASVLLIRPFMRVNKGRLKPMHVVMFIFIVSNCGGALTPIGDPPLYLGFLKGVPFFWTLSHLWPMWLLCIGLLLSAFFVIDSRIGPARPAESSPTPTSTSSDHAGEERFGVSIKGMSGIVALGLIIFGVFLDPLLQSANPDLKGIPIGAMFQIAVALGAHKVANRENLRANEFTFFPVKEVGLLFVGIFTTMAPALGYLASHAGELGLDTPTKFYFATGALSGVLDNAPTYLNFLQVAIAGAGLELNAEGIHEFISHEPGIHDLMAISLGAVFFGALTYIGNGPNFMVRAIAEASGLKMPSFFGYVLRAVFVLVPVLITVWLVFFVFFSPPIPH